MTIVCLRGPKTQFVKMLKSKTTKYYTEHDLKKGQVHAAVQHNATSVCVVDR